MKLTRKKAKKTSKANAIQTAIDRAEKEFHGAGKLERFGVQHNPASGKSKVTLYDDCEDGMNSSHWKIP